MKTKEELNALKEEAETLSAKHRKLSDEELEQVTGGDTFTYPDAVCTNCGATIAGASGGELFTEQAAKEKAEYYSKYGCPNCGFTGTMKTCYVTVEW